MDLSVIITSLQAGIDVIPVVDSLFLDDKKALQRALSEEFSKQLCCV